MTPNRKESRITLTPKSGKSITFCYDNPKKLHFRSMVENKIKKIKKQRDQEKDVVDNIVTDPVDALIVEEQEEIEDQMSSVSERVHFNWRKENHLNYKIVNQEKSEPQSYTTLELIDDLKSEIQVLSEYLATLFPDRINRFKLTDLSDYWVYSSGYIANLKYLYKKNPNNFHVEQSKLLELENNIKEKLGAKALGCLFLFDNFRKGKNSFWDFTEELRKELGRVSGVIELTFDELNLIFGFLVDDLVQRITNTKKRWHNPNYKFSLRKLDLILSNMKEIFGYRAKQMRKLLELYKTKNPGLKEYSLQQHTVKRPHYFSTITTGQIVKAYLFGFLMADGYIESNGYSIGIEVKEGDKSILIKFKETLGVEREIITRPVFKRYKSKIKKYTQSRLRFGCLPMWEDLNNIEYKSSKTRRKSVPEVIKDLVFKAKKEAGSNWYETVSGQTALAWLLGFYDGDGSYSSDGGDYGILYSASKKFLEDIKNIFGFRRKVRVKDKPGDLVHVFDEELISKGYYYLGIDRLPVDIFSLMFNSYHDSFPRKRPDTVADHLNFLGSKD